jgi:Relaxase/Mobilisation nuclease domain
MIINGGSRSNGAFFAAHLANAEHNERVTLCEFRNLAARNLPDAFREMQAVALGTRCENFFYHANINPRSDEELTADQWQFAVDTLEAALGLSEHARFVVEHRKAGRTHRHAIWSRINVRTMTAVRMTDDYEKHQAVARALERQFVLRAERSVLGGNRREGKRPPRRPKTWESFRGKKSGISPSQMKEQVTGAYFGSSGAGEFALRLSQHGCTLVRGSTSGYCIRDEAGHLHSLLRRIEGITADELKAFMRGIDPATLPFASLPKPSAD